MSYHASYGACRLVKILRLGTVFAFCLLLTCCHILESGKPARQVYLLQTPAAPARSAPTATFPTLIISVSAVPGLDTDHILVLGHDAQLNPVANAHWPDHMPEVFTSIIRRFLSDSNEFSSVGQGRIARPGEWLLELELQAFYGTQTSSGDMSAVVLQLEGLLTCGSGQHVLRIAQQVPVNGDSLSQLVAAHQHVLDESMQDLLSGIVTACPPSATD